jgi:S1-C subfamily serine protease
VRGAALLLVAFGIVMTSCGADSNTSTFDTSAIIDATLRVRASGCGPRTGLGTGTAIGDGLVVTAAHVVGGSTGVELVDHRGAATPADVVWFDPDLDIAAVRPADAPSRFVTLRGPPASEGDTGVIAIPLADHSIELRAIDVEQRVTILTTDIYRDADVQRPGLRIAATVEPGDSGAMVHLPDGGVGIVWSRSAERADQAWTVDLPDELVQREPRSDLVEPVDVGPCP